MQAGIYHKLKVARIAEPGFYLEDGKDGILLPKRLAPRGLKKGDEVEVFVYHDSEGRLIATTQKPYGIVGDIVSLEVVSTTAHGSFLDWGLMKDLFVPKSKMREKMYKGEKYLVKIYLDDQTGRVVASQKVDAWLSNDELTVKEMDLVDLVVYRKSDIGVVVIINNRHTGLVHFNEIFRELQPGDRLTGFIKKITEDNKIDVVLGKPGYEKVGDEVGKLLQLLNEHNGYLPYNDKSDPEAIYDFFGMSKKTFKMAVGNLYKNKRIELTQTGIKLLES